MLVVMQEGATEQQIQSVIDRMVDLGFTVHRSTGVVHTVLGGVGPEGRFRPGRFRGDGRASRNATASCRRYKLASRHFRPGGTVVKIGGVEIGGASVVRDGRSVQRGEPRPDLTRRRTVVAEAGAKVMRGGAFKPRSSPYSFQGLGEEGLKLLREAADRHGLLVVSEVMDQTQIPLVAAYADILQVGARNMQNYNSAQGTGQACRSRCC